MTKTLEDFGYHASLILDSDYLIGALQTNIKGKNGFLEIRQKEVSPVYKLEDGVIKALAVIGINSKLMEEVLERISREDIIKSFANINNSNSMLRIAFYNRNQPIDKMLRFHEFKDPVKIDDQFFLDMVRYLSK